METQKIDKISVAVLREKIIKTAAVLQLLADRDVEIEHLKQQLEKLISKYRERTAELNEFKSNLSEYKQYVENVNKANEALKKEVENFKNEHSQLQVSFSKTSLKYQSTCEEYSKLEKETEKQLTEIKNLKEELKKVNKKLQGKNNTKDVKLLKKEIASLRHQLGLKDAEIDALEVNTFEPCIEDDDSDKDYKIEELTNELTQIKAENVRLKTQQYYSETLFVSREELSKLHEKHRQEVKALKQSHREEIVRLQTKIEELRIENNLLDSSECVGNGKLSPISPPNSPKHLNLVGKVASDVQLSDSNGESSECENSKFKSPTSKMCDKPKSTKILRKELMKSPNQQQIKLKSKTKVGKVQMQRQSFDETPNETLENIPETVKLPSVMSISDLGMDDNSSKSSEEEPGDKRQLLLEESQSLKDLNSSSNNTLLEQEPIDVSKIQDSKSISNEEKCNNMFIEENRTDNEKIEASSDDKMSLMQSLFGEDELSDSEENSICSSNSKISSSINETGDSVINETISNKSDNECTIEINSAIKKTKNVKENIKSLKKQESVSSDSKKLAENKHKASPKQKLRGASKSVVTSEELPRKTSNCSKPYQELLDSDSDTVSSEFMAYIFKDNFIPNLLSPLSNAGDCPSDVEAEKDKSIEQSVEEVNNPKSSEPEKRGDTMENIPKIDIDNSLLEVADASKNENSGLVLAQNYNFVNEIFHCSTELTSNNSPSGESGYESSCTNYTTLEKIIGDSITCLKDSELPLISNPCIQPDVSSERTRFLISNYKNAKITASDSSHEKHYANSISTDRSESSLLEYSDDDVDSEVNGWTVSVADDFKPSVKMCKKNDKKHTKILNPMGKSIKVRKRARKNAKQKKVIIDTVRKLIGKQTGISKISRKEKVPNTSPELRSPRKTVKRKLEQNIKIEDSPLNTIPELKSPRKTVKRKLEQNIKIEDSPLNTIPELKSLRKNVKRKLEQNIKIEDTPPQTIRINYVKSGDSKISISEILAKRREAIEKLKTVNTANVHTKQESESVGEPVKKFKRPNVKKEVVSTPLSPPHESETPADILTEPVIIPTEPPKEMTEKHADRLFQELLTYAFEESTLQKISREFVSQKSDRIAFLVMKQIIKDVHDVPDKQYTPPVPPTTETQRILLGFMTNLEKLGFYNLIESFLNQAERQILTIVDLEVLDPLSRFYTICCFYKTDLYRVRKFCCDIVYYMGNYAVPCIFTILSCWLDVLPPAENAADVINSPLVKAIVHVLFSKTCNEAGYKLASLHLILTDYCKFKKDDFNGHILLSSFLDDYIKNPSNDLKFAMVIICKNQPISWVSAELKKLVKPLTEKTEDNGSLNELKLLTQDILKHVPKTNPLVNTVNSWFSKS